MRHYNSFAFGGGEVLNINKLQKFRNLNLQLIGIKIFGLISPINHNLLYFRYLLKYIFLLV